MLGPISGSLAHARDERHGDAVLEEVHRPDGLDQWREAGRERGDVSAQLRQPLLRRERQHREARYHDERVESVNPFIS